MSALGQKRTFPNVSVAFFQDLTAQAHATKSAMASEAAGFRAAIIDL
jgi:hypothetical protein